MKKVFASLLLAFTLIFTPTHKSEAAVGGLLSLAVSVPAVIAVGGVSTLVGGVAFLIGDRTGGDTGFVLFFGGGALLLLGIALLDGEQAIEFAEVNPSMKHLQGISQDDMETYNSELDQLNAINAQITEEAAADRDIDAKARWSEMGEALSPATLKIAGLNGALLMKSLKK